MKSILVKFFSIVILLMVIPTTVCFAAVEIERLPDKSINSSGYTIAHKGKIYSFGGFTGYTSTSNSLTIKTSNVLEIYDIAAGEWNIGAQMPIPTAYSVYAMVEEKIYVIGGRTDGASGGGANKSVQVYDINENSWTTDGYAAVPPTLHRTLYGGAEIDGKIYIFGSGYSGSFSNVSYAYDTVSNLWTQIAPLPGGNASVASAAWSHNGQIYVIPNVGSTVYRYDVASNTYEAAITLPSVARYLGEHGGSHYFGGGKVSYRYDIENNSFEELYNIDQLAGTGRGVLYDGYIYIPGGQYNTLSGSGTGSIKYANTFYRVKLSDNILTIIIGKGEEIQLSVTKNLGDNAVMTWTEIDPSIATVDANGVVTAHSLGITQIYTESADGAYRDFVNVEVLEAEEIDEYRLALDLEVGQSQRLRFSYDPDETWFSHDSSIVTVSPTGVVIAVSEGLALIEAEFNGETGYIYVRVRNS